MIRKVYMNGQLRTLLVFDDYEETGFNPVIETLKEQAERIESLEEQNGELLKQKDLLLHLMEMTIQTEELMARSLQVIKNLEERLGERLSEGDNLEKEIHRLSLETG